VDDKDNNRKTYTSYDFSLLYWYIVAIKFVYIFIFHTALFLCFYYSFELTDLKLTHRQSAWEHGLIFVPTVELKWMRRIRPHSQISSLLEDIYFKSLISVVIQANQVWWHIILPLISCQLLKKPKMNMIWLNSTARFNVQCASTW
jgi:hypothetical protein